MPTKAAILERITRYYGVERGFARTYFTGNKAVDWLNAILELPDFAALDASEEIPFSRVLRELERLGKNYRDIYTPAFLAGTGKSSILFRDLFPSAATDIAASTTSATEHTPRPTLGILGATTAPEAAPDPVTPILKRLRDQLSFYCSCIRRQPPLHSFLGGFVGASGYAGLERAEGYLVLVRQALDNYTRLGVIDPPLLSEAHARRLYLGSHTREIVTPLFEELSNAIRQLLNIRASFVSHSQEGVYGGEDVWLARAEYTIELTNFRDNTSTEYTGFVECRCTIKEFDDFLEGYLSTKRISLRNPSAAPAFDSADFAEKFGQHLTRLVASESRSRAARAEEARKSRQNAIEAGAGM